MWSIPFAPMILFPSGRAARITLGTRYPIMRDLLGNAASLVGVIFMTVSLVCGAVSALVFHAKKKNLEKELDAEYGGKRHK